MIEFKQKVPNLYELTGSELTRLMKYCNELWEEKEWEFKVGDRVENTNDRFGIKIGNKGSVIKLDEGSSFSVAVKFDNNISGHNCEGSGKHGHCYWLKDTDLKLTETESTTTTELQPKTMI